jgi:hypothetical protein
MAQDSPYQKGGGSSRDAEENVRSSKLADRLSQLSKMASLLQNLGLLATASTMSNLFLTFFSFLNREIHFLVPLTLLSLSIVISAVVCALLGLYLNLRRNAEVLFEELSEEMQWYVGKARPRPSKSSDEKIVTSKPELDYRLTLRKYAKSTDLLFVPGTYGPVFYLLLNVLLTTTVYFSGSAGPLWPFTASRS